jgi:hypothetical protein
MPPFYRSYPYVSAAKRDVLLKGRLGIIEDVERGIERGKENG